MLVLGLETSCDDTCCALLQVNKRGFKVLSNIVSSQVKVHAPYGGVVPSLAAREHTKNIVPCLKMCLQGKAGVPLAPEKTIDLIAVTVGPGLAPSLLVGLSAAKTLAYCWQKPLLGINHLEGHICANWLSPLSSKSKVQSPKFRSQKIKFPVICLIVSGGHTLLVLIKAFGSYQVLGQTRDDAAGEAFDKIARLLGLGYPGGPAVAAEAARTALCKGKGFKDSPLQRQGVQGQPSAKARGLNKITLPRPMINSQDFDFSFSGLKTAVLYHFRNQSLTTRKSRQYLQNLCAEVQQAIVDVLITKTLRAAKEFKVKTIMLAGGVAANQHLRHCFCEKVKGLPMVELILPESQYCTDNGLMVALAAYFKIQQQGLAATKNQWQKVKILPNLGLS